MILALFLACASEHDDAEVAGVGEAGTDIPVQTEKKAETVDTVSTKAGVTVTPKSETGDKTETTTATETTKSEETQTTDKAE